MITSAQNKKYTVLHDKLSAVHEQREKNNKDIRDFAVAVKEFFEEIENQLNLIAQKDKSNIIAKTLCEQQENELKILLENFTAVTNKFKDYLLLGKDFNTKVNELMQAMMHHNKIFSSAQLPAQKINLILSQLQTDISNAGIQEKENAKTFQRLYAEFAQVQLKLKEHELVNKSLEQPFD